MKKRGLLITLFAVLLHACGGGGGDDSGDTTTNDPPSSGRLNPQLSGRVFVYGRGSPSQILDLSTGAYSLIPGMETGRTLTVMAYPSHDGEEVVETVRGCEDNGHSLYKDDCIIVHASDGSSLIKLTVFEDIEGPARLSFDRQYIAFAYDYRGDDNISLHIADRAGQLVSHNNLFTQIDSDDDPEFDWLPDGRLVYMVDQTIYITAPYDAHGTPLITFTEEQGVPREPAVSPDGKRLAFELKTGGSRTMAETTVWVMSLDDPSDLHQLAVVPGNDTPSVSHPVWSPDGNWIMVIEGLANGTGPIFFPPSGPDDQIMSKLYAVPSDGIQVELTETNPTTAIPVLSNWQAAVLGDEGKISSKFSGRLVAWVP
jgi:Tol biopolymer transport system component